MAEISGNTFINDSKSTNPGSTIAAINGFAGTSGSLVVILGGQSKGADFTTLRETLLANQADVVIFGEDGPLLEESLDECATNQVSTLEEALEVATRLSADGAKGDCVVLFSPACASFDQFRNFEHRGDRFCQLVQEMKS